MVNERLMMQSLESHKNFPVSDLNELTYKEFDKCHPLFWNGVRSGTMLDHVAPVFQEIAFTSFEEYFFSISKWIPNGFPNGDEDFFCLIYLSPNGNDIRTP